MIWTVVFWASVAVVLVSYGGYGLWAAWRARTRPVPIAAGYVGDDELPTVTCVIAARNEAALIERKLRAIEGQDYPPHKLSIVVVSDGSTDETESIVGRVARQGDRIHLLTTGTRRGKPTALNLARRFIRGDVAVFMDVRQQITKNAIRELVAHLNDRTVGVVSGDYRLDGDLYWRFERFVRRCESRSGTMVQVTGSLYAIRTADVPELPPDIILDDVYVPMTVALGGRRIVMAEEAGSVDVATRSVGSEYRRKVRTLAGLVQICHAVPRCLNPKRNPAWGRLVIHKLSRLVCPYALLLIFLASWMSPLVVYRLGVVGTFALLLLAVAPRLGFSTRLTSASQSFLALNFAALCALPAYYFGWATVTWARVEVDRS